MSDNKGSFIFFLYTVMTYAYAAVMLYVFYFVPKKSGLVVELTLDGSEFKLETNLRS